MIKSIQLLKESFATYKANFKNIVGMTWPILLLTLISGYYSMNMEGMSKTKPAIMSVIIIGSIVIFITTLIISLFLQPALYRSIQKKEDGKEFDVKDGYSFAKKNMWNLIVLIFWQIIYSIKVNYKYILTIIASVIVWGITIFFIKNTTTQMIVSSVLVIVCLVVAIMMIIKNFTKFVLYVNVFFSDDVKPRESVLKSIELGKKHNKDIWKIVLSVVLFSIITYIVYIIIGSISGLMSTKESTDIIATIFTSLVVSFVTTPLSFIILAKGYSKINHSKVSEVVEGEMVV